MQRQGTSQGRICLDALVAFPRQHNLIAFRIFTKRQVRRFTILLLRLSLTATAQSNKFPRASDDISDLKGKSSPSSLPLTSAVNGNHPAPDSQLGDMWALSQELRAKNLTIKARSTFCVSRPDGVFESFYLHRIDLGQRSIIFKHRSRLASRADTPTSIHRFDDSQRT